MPVYVQHQTLGRVADVFDADAIWQAPGLALFTRRPLLRDLLERTPREHRGRAPTRCFSHITLMLPQEDVDDDRHLSRGARARDLAGSLRTLHLKDFGDLLGQDDVRYDVVGTEHVAPGEIEVRFGHAVYLPAPEEPVLYQITASRDSAVWKPVCPLYQEQRLLLLGGDAPTVSHSVPGWPFGDAGGVLLINDGPDSALEVQVRPKHALDCVYDPLSACYVLRQPGESGARLLLRATRVGARAGTGAQSRHPAWKHRDGAGAAGAIRVERDTGASGATGTALASGAASSGSARSVADSGSVPSVDGSGTAGRTGNDGGTNVAAIPGTTDSAGCSATGPVPGIASAGVIDGCPGTATATAGGGRAAEPDRVRAAPARGPRAQVQRGASGTPASGPTSAAPQARPLDATALPATHGSVAMDPEATYAPVARQRATLVALALPRLSRYRDTGAAALAIGFDGALRITADAARAVLRLTVDSADQLSASTDAGSTPVPLPATFTPVDQRVLRIVPVPAQLADRYLALVGLPEPDTIGIAPGARMVFGRAAAPLSQLRVLAGPGFVRQQQTGAGASADRLGLSRQAFSFEVDADGYQITRLSPTQALYHLDQQLRFVAAVGAASPDQPYLLPAGHHLVAGHYVLRFDA